MIVASLHRYPVKGLSPEEVETLHLRAGQYVPADRLYAVENGPSGFDPAAPRHQPKIKFLMLMRNGSLARLRTRYLDDSTTLVVEHEGREVVRANLASAEGRLSLEAFLRRVMPGELRGPPKVLTAPDGFRFTDSRRGFVSIINRASVLALEDAIGRPVDLLRFRGNLSVEDLPAWAEFDLVGRELLASSGLRLRVSKRIVRCAATEVDPRTGDRDIEVVRALAHHFGHTDLGVYAEIVRDGTIRPGDRLDAVGSEQAELAFE